MKVQCLYLGFTFSLSITAVKLTIQALARITIQGTLNEH
jgi:hypothetical protein